MVTTILVGLQSTTIYFPAILVEEHTHCSSCVYLCAIELLSTKFIFLKRTSHCYRGLKLA